MATTGPIEFTQAETINESPWLDEPWVNPTNALADDGADAAVTAATFDNGDQTAVLKVFGANVALAAALPSDLVSIDGVIVRVNGYSDSAALVDFDLVQLLDTARAKGGTNQASTTVQMGTDTAAVHVFGSSSDLWGRALTRAWCIDADFGVAIGVLAQTNNSQAFIDYVTIEVFYSPAATAHTEDPADTVSIADETTVAWTADRRTDSPVEISDSFSRVHEAQRTPADTVSLADAIAISRGIVAADTVSIADEATPVLTPGGGTAHELNPADTVSIADAVTKDIGKAVADTVSIVDAIAKAREKAIADTVGVADQFSKASQVARAFADGVEIADDFVRVAAFQRTPADTVSIADAADPVLGAPEPQHYQLEFNDTVAIDDDVQTARAIVRTLDDTVGVSDQFARTLEAHRLFTDALTLSDSLAAVKTSVVPGILDVGDVRHVRLSGKARHVRAQADTRLVRAQARARLR